MEIICDDKKCLHVRRLNSYEYVHRKALNHEVPAIISCVDHYPLSRGLIDLYWA